MMITKDNPNQAGFALLRLLTQSVCRNRDSLMVLARLPPPRSSYRN